MFQSFLLQILLVSFLCICNAQPLCHQTTETVFDGVVLNILNYDPQTSFLYTATTLYRSTDGGVTWVNQTDKLISAQRPDTRIRKVIFSTPADLPYNVYVVGHNGSLWTSRDGGDTFTQGGLPMDLDLLSILPHPFEKEVLAGAIGNYSETSIPPYMWAFAESDDGGMTWSRRYPPLYYNTAFSSIPTYLYTQGSEPYWSWTTSQAGQRTFYALFLAVLSNTYSPLVMSSDNAFSTNALAPANELPVYAFTYSVSTSSWLLVSYNKTYVYYVSAFNIALATQIVTNVNPLAQVAALSTLAGSTFVTETNGTLTNLYKGTSFTDLQLSLQNTYPANSAALTDLYIFSSHNKTIFANQINGTRVVTVWSSDGGSTWMPVQAPANMSCSNCSLLIPGQASNPGVYGAFRIFDRLYPNVYCLGQVGTGNTVNASNDTPFESTDGGNSWNQIPTPNMAMNNFLFDVSAIAMYLTVRTPTNNLWYSFDNGTDWGQCLFTPASDNRTHNVKTFSTTLFGKTENSLWLVTSWKDSNNATKNSYFYTNFSLPACQMSDYNTTLGPCVNGMANVTYSSTPNSLCTQSNLPNTTACNDTNPAPGENNFPAPSGPAPGTQPAPGGNAPSGSAPAPAPGSQSPTPGQNIAPTPGQGTSPAPEPSNSPAPGQGNAPSPSGTSPAPPPPSSAPANLAMGLLLNLAVIVLAHSM